MIQCTEPSKYWPPSVWFKRAGNSHDDYATAEDTALLSPGRGSSDVDVSVTSPATPTKDAESLVKTVASDRELQLLKR